jgi:hypothetical protein
MNNHIQQYYVQGREAFRKGSLITDNPFQVVGSAARNSWEAGYTEEWYESTFGENNGPE